MNLLILVSAVFVIVSFFMISLSNVMLESVASSYIKQKEKDVYNIAVVSQSLCETNTFYLQNSIETNPANAFSRGLYYAMVIKSIPIESGPSKGLNRIIFQIFPRTDLKHLIAADSFDVDAEIKFFECTENGCIESSQLLLDPQQHPKTNAFILVKEVVGGKKFLYFIPCSTEGRACEDNFSEAEAAIDRDFYCGLFTLG